MTPSGQLGLSDGLLLIDKPTGPTSHDIVAAVRRASGERRIGHAGTLDPLATGLLPLLIGRATRLLRFLDESPKVYEGSLRLGVETDTHDDAGQVTATHDGALPAATAVQEAAMTLVGRFHQVPPAFSAKKIAGRRAYTLARQGAPVDPPAAEVNVERFDLVQHSESTFHFEVAVSRGTYVRALVRDLGRRLSCGATMLSLRRLAIGPMHVDQALPVAEPLRQLERDTVVAALQPLKAIPLAPPTAALVDRLAVQQFSQGRVLPAPHGVGEGWVRVVAEGELLGIGCCVSGQLQPRVVLTARADPEA